MKNTAAQFCFTHTTGEDVFLFVLRNTKGTEISITNYGAIITAFRVKHDDGNVNDIVLGFDRVEDYLSAEYLAGYPYFGAAIGRYANRIKQGEFSIDGQRYFLAKNKVTDHLHGGLEGFDRKVWQVLDSSGDSLKLKYISADGEEGYPGNLEVELSFRITNDNELLYEYRAETDRATAVNLTHHSYFNLHNGRGTIADHIATIHASAILRQDDNFVVDGELIPVNGNHYDFREPKQVSKEWIAGDGYDQSYVLDQPGGEMKLAAELCSNHSKLRLEIHTTEPLVHFYTGKWIPGITGKNGERYGPFSGLCFETHKHPNSVNISHFPNTILRPGETYHTRTMYRLIN